MPPDVLCKRRGNPLLRRGALLALSARYVKERLRSCIGSVTEPGILRISPTNGVLRSRYRQATPSTAKIAHLGYALMPYRLDTNDAIASLALTSDTSTKRRSIATLRHPASTSERGGAPTLKRVGRSLQPMCSRTRYWSASTA